MPFPCNGILLTQGLVLSTKFWVLRNFLNEGSFLGIFQDLITKVLFEKSSELIFKILIYYYIDEFCCFKIMWFPWHKKCVLEWNVKCLVRKEGKGDYKRETEREEDMHE